MSVVMDRLKASFNALVRAAMARVPYAAPRIARVVSATTGGDGSTLMDVVPEDPLFPSMQGVPLFHGSPGESITLSSGTRVVVEFSEADPARPFVRCWAGGESVAVRTLSAQTLNLGGLGATPAAVAAALLALLPRAHRDAITLTTRWPAPSLGRHCLSPTSPTWGRPMPWSSRRPFWGAPSRARNVGSRMGTSLLNPRQTRKATKRAAARKAKEDRRVDLAVEKELAAMGIEARAVSCAVVLNTTEMAAKLDTARIAGEPYVGAEGYHRLRAVFTETLTANGVDMVDLMLKFTWDPGTSELGVAVGPSPEASARARAAVLERIPKLALV